MTTALKADARANAVAGALVGAVVLVLGFGSGISAVFSHHTAFSSPAAGPHTASAVTASGVGAAPEGSAAAVPAGNGAMLGTGTFGARPATGAAGSASSSAGMSAMPATMSTSSGAGSTAHPAAGTSSAGAGAGTCSNQMVLDAMLAPFFLHFDHAHLEESPSQQAGDLTNPDQYVKTHTVLVEQMVAPAVALGLVSTQGVQPFVTHFDHAHLEESPAQQSADLLNANQYVKTHTVLIEDMTAPATGSLAGTYGC